MTAKPQPNLAGRIWTAFIGLILIGMGSLFVWYLWAAYQKASITSDWIETPCRMITSTIDDSELTQHYMPKYTLEVAYEYEFEGKTYTGNKVKRLSVQSASLKKVERTQAKYPIGSPLVCFVNPESPGDAVLKKGSKGSLYSIWFPCLFVIGGVGIFVASFKRTNRVRSSD